MNRIVLLSLAAAALCSCGTVSKEYRFEYSLEGDVPPLRTLRYTKYVFPVDCQYGSRLVCRPVIVQFLAEGKPGYIPSQSYQAWQVSDSQTRTFDKEELFTVQDLCPNEIVPLVDFIRSDHVLPEAVLKTLPELYCRSPLSFGRVNAIWVEGENILVSAGLVCTVTIKRHISKRKTTYEIVAAEYYTV